MQADHPYRFEYQFNWQELSNVNAYACSYLTVENRQRLDYLPAGSSYVLVETEVPAGFVRAPGYADHSNGYGRNSVVSGGK